MHTFVFEMAYKRPGAHVNSRIHVKASTLWDARELLARIDVHPVLNVTTSEELKRIPGALLYET